jgi:hypothetical protein
MFVSHHRTTGQNCYIKVADKSFENVAKYKYLGMMLTNQNCIHKEIKRRLNMGNACYHSDQNFCVPILYLKSVKIKIYKIMIFTSCFVWVWNLVSHVKGRTQIEGFWEQGAWDNIGPKRDEVMEGWRKLHKMRGISWLTERTVSFSRRTHAVWLSELVLCIYWISLTFIIFSIK